MSHIMLTTYILLSGITWYSSRAVPVILSPTNQMRRDIINFTTFRNGRTCENSEDLSAKTY